jgi:hypothetical protein
MDTDERFWAKVAKSDGCWLWTAGKDGKGYGAAYVNLRQVRAHRLAYELVVGPIPGGMTIDHLCRNRACVNPAHMEVVTRGENTARSNRLKAAEIRAQSHCKHGHEYTPENTYIRPDGARICRHCTADSQLRYHQRRHSKT